jgi:hypothetical protein
MSRARLLAAALAASSLLGTPTVARADEVEECASAAETGQKRRDEGKLLDAKQALIRCAQASCPAVIQGDCAKWLPEVDARIPSLVLRAVSDSGEDLRAVRVARDGQPWLPSLDGASMPIDPGPLKLRFEADGFEPLDKEVVVAEGQRSRIIEVELRRTGGAPKETPAPPPEEAASGGPGPLPWIFLGVGAAGLGTFGVFQIVAAGEVSDIEDGCGASRTCTDDDLDPTRTKLVVSAIGLGVGIAGVSAAVLTFVLASGGEGGGSATTLTPSIGPGGAGVSLRGPIAF